MQNLGDPDASLTRSLENWIEGLFGPHPELWVAVTLAILAGALAVLWRTARLASSQRRRIRALESKLHGSAVRRGYATEALAPLLDSFPVEIGKPDTTTLFVGQPVDYIHFDAEHGVTFIEIKSGSAKLNARQRRLKELIERGAVEWQTMHVPTGAE